MFGNNSESWRLAKLISVVTLVIGLAAVTWFISGYGPLLQLKSRPMMPLAFTPRGDVLATGELVQDGLSLKPVSPIRFLNSVNGVEVGPPFPTLSPPLDGNPLIPREILHAEFSPDGSLLAVLQEHHDFKRIEELELIVFVRATQERLINVSIPYSSSAADKACTLPRTLFSPDGKWLLCVEYSFPERSVRVWDLQSGTEKYTLSKLCYPVFSPDSIMIAMTQYWRTRGDEPFAVQLVDVQTGALRRTINLQGTSEGWCPWPSFSPNGELLAVNSRDGKGKQTVEVFETASGTRVFQQEAWSPHLLSNGRTLVTVKNQDVQLWDIDSWTLRGNNRFELGTHWANGAEMSPEPVLISGSPLVAVFDCKPTSNASFLPWLGKKFQLNAFGSQRVALIDGTSASRQLVVLHNDLFLRNPVWSPDGSRMAIGSVNGTLSVWAVPPRKSLVPLLCASAVVILVATIGFAQKSLRRWKDSAMKGQAC